MGFAVAGPDRFLVSGHPGAGDDGPTHLGPIESTDAGRTWRTLSQGGEADFHALEAAQGAVYGLDSTSGQLMASADSTSWASRPAMPLHDLAVDPENAQTLLATTGQGVQRSAADVLYLATADGSVSGGQDAGATWDILHS